MDIEEFYDADERRRTSEEVELGREWTDAAGNRFELSWVEDTGELYLMAEPVEAVEMDPVGDTRVDDLPVTLVTVEILATVPDRAALDTLLAGWEREMPKRGSLDWVRRQVALRLRATAIAENTTIIPTIQATAFHTDDESAIGPPMLR